MNRFPRLAKQTGLTGIILAVLSFSLPEMAPAQMAQQGTGGMGPGIGPGMGAGPGGGRMMPSFNEFDADGDGQISQSEFDQARAQRIAERSRQGYRMRGLANAPSFTDLDSNGDGSLNQDEFTSGVVSHHQQPRQ